MTESLTSFKNLSETEVDNRSGQLYFVLGILANAAIWGSAFLAVNFQPPTYTSSLNAILPGASDGNVSVPNVGNASYQTPVSSQDYRETYRVIATSEPVVKAAAEQLNLSSKSFRPPKYRIKIVPNSTMMTFEVQAASPTEAQNKTLAIYQAFQTRLNVLRAQEALQREVGFQSALSSAEKRLEVAQKRLSEYKARSGLNSNAQVAALSNNIEQLRTQRVQIIAQQQQAITRLKEISAKLNPSAQPPEGASIIQTDQIFQQNLKTYSDASAALVVLTSKFLPNHPTVVAEKAKRDAAQKAMLTRSQYLLGQPISQATLQQLSPIITNESAREIISQQAEARALRAQAQEVNQQIIQLEGRLKTLALQEGSLDALTRDFKVAEAVFTSTLGKLDIGRSNVFGSYPLIQPLAEPSLSLVPIQKIVFLGATLGSLLLTTGIVLLWLRKRKTWIPEREFEEAPKHKKNGLSFPETKIESHSS